MDLPSLRWLLTTEGRAATMWATDLPTHPPLARISALRRRFPLPQAQALAELIDTRRRARRKFSRAAELFFVAEALEQASSEPVARHRAMRFAGSTLVVDIGCGAGGDALALAEAAPLIAIDRDQLRLELARANLTQLGRADRASFAVADATTLRLATLTSTRGAALFLDPGRRQAGQRRFDPAEYEPPLSFVADLARQGLAAAVKVAPGIDWRRLPFDAEVEIVSFDGEVKEAVLWTGQFRSVARRATVIRTGSGADGAAVAAQRLWQARPDSAPPAAPTTDDPVNASAGVLVATLVAADVPPIEARAPGRYLCEPDGAVIRAGLVQDLADQLNAWLVDPTIAYLSADAPTPTPFGRWFRIDEAAPFNQKRLTARLRELGVGRPVVKKRGSPLEPEPFADAIRGPGDRRATVVLTRVLGQPTALICDLDP